MISLQSYDISANIINRYASVKYSMDFKNNNADSAELKFEITVEPDAFISKFEADIDGQLFIGQTKERKTADKEYKEAKKKKENAILILQPHKNIPNIFGIKTNIDSESNIKLEITIEQYLKKKFDFNELCIQILRNFEKYNIRPEFTNIGFTFALSDDHGFDDIFIPSLVDGSTGTQSVEQTMDESEKICHIVGKIRTRRGDEEKSTDSDNQWVKMLKVGDKIEVRHEQNWLQSKIMEINEGQIKVGYVDLSEYIDISSDRLSPYGTHTVVSKINELILKYKTKNQTKGSHVLFDRKSNTFCHIISNILKDNDKEREQSITSIPRRVIFVIDKSGSMQGSKWNKTVSATINVLNKLKNGYDRFNIILFSSDIDILSGSDLIYILCPFCKNVNNM